MAVGSTTSCLGADRGGVVVGEVVGRVVPGTPVVVVGIVVVVVRPVGRWCLFFGRAGVVVIAVRPSLGVVVGVVPAGTDVVVASAWGAGVGDGRAGVLPFVVVAVTAVLVVVRGGAFLGPWFGRVAVVVGLGRSALGLVVVVVVVGLGPVMVVGTLGLGSRRAAPVVVVLEDSALDVVVLGRGLVVVVT
jgi:hypothetical protein